MHQATPPSLESDDEEEEEEEEEEETEAGAEAGGKSYSQMKQMAFDDDGVKLREVQYSTVQYLCTSANTCKPRVKAKVSFRTLLLELGQVQWFVAIHTMHACCHARLVVSCVF